MQAAEEGASKMSWRMRLSHASRGVVPVSLRRGDDKMRHVRRWLEALPLTWQRSWEGALFLWTRL